MAFDRVGGAVQRGRDLRRGHAVADEGEHLHLAPGEHVEGSEVGEPALDDLEGVGVGRVTLPFDRDDEEHLLGVSRLGDAVDRALDLASVPDVADDGGLVRLDDAPQDRHALRRPCVAEELVERLADRLAGRSLQEELGAPRVGEADDAVGVDDREPDAGLGVEQGAELERRRQSARASGRVGSVIHGRMVPAIALLPQRRVRREESWDVRASGLLGSAPARMGAGPRVGEPRTMPAAVRRRRARDAVGVREHL